jgi:Ni/Co efflux regulator RcnB
MKRYSLALALIASVALAALAAAQAAPKTAHPAHASATHASQHGVRERRAGGDARAERPGMPGLRSVRLSEQLPAHQRGGGGEDGESVVTKQ